MLAHMCGWIFQWLIGGCIDKQRYITIDRYISLYISITIVCLLCVVHYSMLYSHSRHQNSNATVLMDLIFLRGRNSLKTNTII